MHSVGFIGCLETHFKCCHEASLRDDVGHIMRDVWTRKRNIERCSMWEGTNQVGATRVEKGTCTRRREKRRLRRRVNEDNTSE